MTSLTVPLLINLPLPEPMSAEAGFRGMHAETESRTFRAMQTWERLSLLRREIVALRSWLRDSAASSRLPSRWVVESRLQQLNEEADRLSAETARRRPPQHRFPTH